MTFDCGMCRVSWERSDHGTTVRRPLRAGHSAFTLVELLVTITIIGILASMLLGAASLSMGSARQAKTEALVTRLHTLLVQHYDTYRTRRVEVSDTALTTVANAGGDSRSVLARTRLLATREQLRIELPDRWSDITLYPIPTNNLASRPDRNQSTPVGDATYLNYLQERPSISKMYWRRFQRIAGNLEGATDDNTNGVADGVEALLANQGAECLYLIITLACGDGESAALFKENEIGDTDGDGAPEFLDGWGQPIEFLRWAPGFDSDSQLDVPELAALADDDLRATAIAKDRDPFDLFRIDRYVGGNPRGFRVVPLIYSAGPDKEFGIQDGATFAGNDVTTRNIFFTSDQDGPFEQVSDPFLRYNGAYLGTLTDRSVATDNVHNHEFKGR